jgi:hypothetical protein
VLGEAPKINIKSNRICSMKPVLLIFLISIYSSGYSCVCMFHRLGIDSSYILNKENEIAVGRLIRKQRRVHREDDYKQPYTIYTFKLKKNYTLSTKKKFVKIISTRSACGLNFRLGLSYLFTSSEPYYKGIYRTTSICRYNYRLRDAADEIELIERVLAQRIETEPPD